MCLYVLGGRGCCWSLVLQIRQEPRPRGERRLWEGCRGQERASGEGALIALIRLPRLHGPLPVYITAAASLRISLPQKSLTASPSLYKAEERTREGQQLIQGIAKPGLKPRSSSSSCVCYARWHGPVRPILPLAYLALSPSQVFRI